MRQALRKSVRPMGSGYAIAATVDLGLLDNAYGGLDFFFNSRIRRKVYCEIYQRIHTFQSRLFEESFHFDQLKKGRGKFSVCADKAYQICQLAFTDSEKVVDDISEKVVYQELFDEIENSLEWFRCKIYRNEKFKPPERKAVLGTIQTFSLDKK